MKKIKGTSVQEPYRSGYAKAAKGLWWLEQYFIVSHLERRKADPVYNKKIPR